MNLTVIGNPVFTVSRDLSFPRYHVIYGTKGLNSAYLILRRLQYLYNDRKSFLLSILSVASSWMCMYTGCDDVTQWRQAAYAYTVLKMLSKNQNIWLQSDIDKK